jgi:hypothetical protein
VLGVLLVLVLLVALMGVGLTLAGRRARRLPWRAHERPTATGDVVLELRRPGEQPVEVGRVAASDDAVTFSDALATARAEADERAAALNAGRELGR